MRCTHRCNPAVASSHIIRVTKIKLLHFTAAADSCYFARLLVNKIVVAIISNCLGYFRIVVGVVGFYCFGGKIIVIGYIKIIIVIKIIDCIIGSMRSFSYNLVSKEKDRILPIIQSMIF